MRPKKRAETVIEVDVRKLLMLAVTVILCLIAVITLFFYIRSLMRIQNFSLSGVSQYDRNEIVNASGLKRGDLLYSIDKKAIAEKILEECPYLESVKIKQKFPNTLSFSVEERTPLWYIEVTGSYYALDSDLRVIDESASETKFLNGKVTKLVLPNLKSVISGKMPEFGEGENEIRKTCEVISIVRSTPFMARITKVDVTSRFDIYLSIDGTYEVYMGDKSDFEAKLRVLEKILDSEEVKKYPAAEIDVSVPSATSFKPKKLT